MYLPDHLIPYEGQKYLAFLDESFYEFFGLARSDGNICYACVALPEKTYPHVRNGMRELFLKYRALCATVLGRQETEWKSTILARLPVEFQHETAKQLHDLLKRYGGVIGIFFAPVHGLIMERARERCVSRGLKTVPADHDGEYKSAREDLKNLPINVLDRPPSSPNYRKMPGQMRILVETVHDAIVAVNNTMLSLGSMCDLFHDPREKLEDAAVDEHYEILRDRIPGSAYDKMNRIRFRPAKPSEAEAGLQWADLLAGAFRHFFLRNDELLNRGSSWDLIPQGCWSEQFRIIRKGSEYLHEVFRNSALFPNSGEVIVARSRKLPDEIAKLFNTSSEPYATLFKDILAQQSVSLFTHKGEKRRIDLGESVLEDEMDNSDPYGEYYVTYSYERKILRLHCIPNPGSHQRPSET